MADDETPERERPEVRPGIHEAIIDLVRATPVDPAAVAEDADDAPEEEVLEGCTLGRDGEPRATLRTALAILRMSTRWSGRVQLDRWSGRVLVDGRERRDVDATRVREWAERVYGVVLAADTTWAALDAVAHEQTVDVGQAWLRALPAWDGVARCQEVWTRYAGVEDVDLHRAYGHAWMVGIARRILYPGCGGVETVPVLVGTQGAGKTRLVRALVPDPRWLLEVEGQLSSKDTLMAIRGRMLVCMDELSSMRKTDIESIKSWLSTTEDSYRAPYGREVETVPRRCGYVATTNDMGFLSDTTGNRRFWPMVVCRTTDRIDVDGAREARDQLWAEARDRALAGEVSWLPTELEEAQAQASGDYETADLVEQATLAWAASAAPGRHYLPDIAMAIEEDHGVRCDRKGRTIAAMLRRAGWSSRKVGGRITFSKSDLLID